VKEKACDARMEYAPVAAAWGEAASVETELANVASEGHDLARARPRDAVLQAQEKGTREALVTR